MRCITLLTNKQPDIKITTKFTHLRHTRRVGFHATFTPKYRTLEHLKNHKLHPPFSTEEGNTGLNDWQINPCSDVISLTEHHIKWISISCILWQVSVAAY